MSTPRDQMDEEGAEGQLDGDRASGLRSDYRPERMRPRREPDPPPRGRGWVLLVLAMVMLLGGLYVFREPLADRLLPATDRARLLDEADRALAAGRLSSPSDGRGARELYTAVLALEPDHAPARDGLRAVAQAALARAVERIASDDNEGAREALALARSLALPMAELAPVEASLRLREAEESELGKLLERAERARREERLDDGPDSAVAIYLRAREVAPDSALVQVGLRGALSDLLQRALWALQADDAAAAERIVQRVQEVDPGHLDLPGLRARLAEWRQAADSRVEARFDEGELARYRGDLVEAAAIYRQVLASRPAHGGARAGLDAIAEIHARLANEAAVKGDFAMAEDRLAIAYDLSPAHPAIPIAERELARRRGGAGLRPVPPVEVDDDLEGLLAAAAVAVVEERFVEPPGESAWDLLRAARAVAPDDARIGTAVAALVPAAMSCVEDNLASNRLSRAGECLQAVVVMAPGDPGLPLLRRRVAARWIGHAEERLGASELAAARRAYEAAREIDAAHPDLVALAARLEQAGAPRQ